MSTVETILMGTPADKPLIVDGVAYVPYKLPKHCMKSKGLEATLGLKTVA